MQLNKAKLYPRSWGRISLGMRAGASQGDVLPSNCKCKHQVRMDLTDAMLDHFTHFM